MAAPFEAAFAAQQQKRESELFSIHYRDEEVIYIKALPDRVTVIFSTEFKDEADKVYGKLFLQVNVFKSFSNETFTNRKNRNSLMLVVSLPSRMHRKYFTRLENRHWSFAEFWA